MRTWSTVTVLLLALSLLSACDESIDGGGCCVKGNTPVPVLQVTTTTLPTCGFNADYLQTLAAANGTQPYTWSLVSGTLPGNMEITVVGELVGNPLIQFGTFNFRVRVSDSAAATAEADFSLDVSAPPPGPGFFGEPVVTQFVFVLDVSVQAATIDPGKSQSRLARSIAEVQTTLATLNSPYDKFEILAYGGSGLSRCFGSLQYNTGGISALAQSFLSGLAAGGEAPTYSALRSAYLDYGVSLDIVMFCIAATPGVDGGAPGMIATYANILTDSPAWFATQASGQLIVLDAIGAGAPQSFAQQLAALAGGTYNVVP